MESDDFQQRWLAQDRKIDEALRINKRLWLRTELAVPRRSLRWLRLGALINILFGALCLLWTGTFISRHFAEPRFVIPAALLHLWLVGAVATSAVEFLKAGAIEYDAPVLEIQRQLESLRAFTMRSTEILFLSGVAVWWVPFCIVAMRSWLGVNLYHFFSGRVLIENEAGSVALGVAIIWLCRRFATHLDRSPRGRRLLRSLAGHNLAAAQNKIAEIAAFERGD